MVSWFVVLLRVRRPPVAPRSDHRFPDARRCRCLRGKGSDRRTVVQPGGAMGRGFGRRGCKAGRREAPRRPEPPRKDPPSPMPRRAASAALPLPDLVVLVLHGGGALGAYQAGVYDALIDLGIELDWVAGSSIGAINHAITA